MRDSLNLPDIVAQGKLYRRQGRQILRNLLVVLVVGTLVVGAAWALGSPTIGALYLLRAGAWEAVNVPGNPVDVQVSPSGIVWVLTVSPDRLHRYDGEEWTDYSLGFDFHVPCIGSCLLRFALQGEQVWLTVNDSVVQLDGVEWTVYENILPDEWVTGITATESAVIIVNRDGQLTTLIAGQWRTDPPASVLPQYEANSQLPPTLSQSPDGIPWLVFNGVWYFEDGLWKRSFDYDGYLLGVDREYLWFLTSDGVAGLSLDTATWRLFPLAQEDHPMIRIRDGYIWAVADSGVFVFDNGEWQPAAATLPPTPLQPSSIAPLSADSAWVVATDRTEVSSTMLKGVTSSYGFGLLATCGMPIVLGVSFYMLMRYAIRSQKRVRRAREIISTVLPQVPPRPSLFANHEKATRRLALALLVYVLIFVGLVFAGVILNMPPWLGVLSVVLLIVLPSIVGLWWSTQRLRDRTLDAESRAHVRSAFLFNLMQYGALLAGCLILLSLIFSSAFFLENLLVGFMVYFGSVLLLFVLILSLAVALPMLRIIKGPLARGDYETALRQISRMRRVFPRRVNLMGVHTLILGTQGQYAQAETLTLDLMTEAQNQAVQYQGVYMANLGVYRTEQQHYAEALPVLETAILMIPEYVFGYLFLAEFYLLQNAEPQRALELCEAAQTFLRRNFNRSLIPHAQWAAETALHGWALAANGRHDEANVQVQRALDAVPPKLCFAVAEVYLIAGHIRLLQEDLPGARGFWAKAAETDPNGGRGSRARDLLAQHAA